MMLGDGFGAWGSLDDVPEASDEMDG
jgi:hypothetical protein